MLTERAESLPINFVHPVVEEVSLGSQEHMVVGDNMIRIANNPAAAAQLGLELFRTSAQTDTLTSTIATTSTSLTEGEGGYTECPECAPGVELP